MTNDDSIIAEIRNNNEAALAVLYRTHYPMVRNLILTNSGTEPEAKDIYQETIIAFYEKVKRSDFSLTCLIKTYLYAVARRLWLKQLALKKRSVAHIDELESVPGIDGDMDDGRDSAEAFEAMETALNGLGEPCRTLLEEFYIKGATMDALRDRFGYSSNDSAKNQKYKCLQRLKGLFFSGQQQKS